MPFSLAAQVARVAGTVRYSATLASRKKMSFTPPYKYIQADDLAKLLRARSETPTCVAVVDVRGT